MDNTFEKADELTKNIRDYVNTRISLAKLEIAEKTSSLISRFIAFLIVLLFLMSAWIFLNVSLAFFLTDVFGKKIIGFLIVGGLNLFIAWVIWLTKNSLIRIPIMNAIIKMLYPNEEES
jgi:putative flippase GtrA